MELTLGISTGCFKRGADPLALHRLHRSWAWVMALPARCGVLRLTGIVPLSWWRGPGGENGPASMRFGGAESAWLPGCSRSRD